MGDVATVLRKEWKEMAQLGAGRLHGPVAYHAGLAAVSAFLALQTGPGFTASWRAVFLAGALAALSVANVVTDSFAGERERHTLETLLATRLSDRAILLGKLGAAVLHGCTAGLLLLLVGTVAVAVRFGSAPHAMLAVAALFTLAAALPVAAVGVTLSLRAPSVRQAQQGLMVGLMVLLVAPFALPRLFPAAVQAVQARVAELGPVRAAVVAALLLAALGAVATAVAARRFRRARLVGS